MPVPETPQLLTTGIEGLDEVLNGGLPCYRLYLIQGDPGVGKTTLALQFLLEGVRHGEEGLYITLSETEEEIRSIASSHGWSLDGIELFELSALQQTMDMDAGNTLFVPAEVDLRETTSTLLKRVDEVSPTRVVFDSLSEMRLLAQSSLRYRREILALKQYFAGKHSTVLLLDDRTSEPGDLQLESLAHGVIALEQVVPGYGAERRRLRVTKLRGMKFRGGYHDYLVETGGLLVFPRLVAADHAKTLRREVVPSGVGELDELLGGGLHSGTSTLIMGPAGSGKSSIALQYAVAATQRGERAAIFCFEESRETLLARGDALGMRASQLVSEGKLLLRQVDPAEMGPGEFSYRASRTVEDAGAKVIVLDSLNGYLNSMPDERHLAAQMHELLAYFGRKGVATLLVMAQHGVLGSSMDSPVDVTYLADSVILTRYFEAQGTVRKAISVIKKRSGRHEDTIREWSLGADGLRVGKALSDFSGVFSGTPTYLGGDTALLSARE